MTNHSATASDLPSAPASSSSAESAALQSALSESASLIPSHSLLSDKAILHYLSAGRVVIFPFHLSHLSTTSYDVTLGPHYYRESTPEPGCGIYNPYCLTQVQRVWGAAREAELHSDWAQRTSQPLLTNIHPSDRLIWIAPGETILGHTEEYIGGLQTITTMMKARSSMGRNFIEVCKCAGWGDIGYTNRWTMEITNNSRYYSIPLVVGRRIAQLIFFDSDGALQGGGGQGSYERSGKYQSSDRLEVVRREWKPSDMLPKMYLDREIARDNATLPIVPIIEEHKEERK